MGSMTRQVTNDKKYFAFRNISARLVPQIDLILAILTHGGAKMAF
jgi:hypothetical protein